MVTRKKDKLGKVPENGKRPVLGTLRAAVKVKEFREKAGLSQAELGERIGSFGPQINRIETGKTKVTVKTLDALAKALGVDVSEFLK